MTKLLYLKSGVRGRKGDREIETKVETMNPMFGFSLGKVSTLAHLIMSSEVKPYGPNMAIQVPSF